MRFTVTWRHSDGSVVEFSESGWKSADTEKSDWLRTMSDLSGTAPAIPPVIKLWLEENCELVDFQGSPDLLINTSSPPQRKSEPKESCIGGPAIKKPGRPNSSKGSLQLAKRRIFEQFILIRDKSGE
jgi:hypothetical protein